MNRPPKIFLAGAVLTVAYVVTTTAIGWDGWLIAVVGLGLGFAYSLIATPLALGPSLDRKADSPDPAQLRFDFDMPGFGSIYASARRVVRAKAERTGSVWTPHGNGAPQ